MVVVLVIEEVVAMVVAVVVAVVVVLVVAVVVVVFCVGQELSCFVMCVCLSSTLRLPISTPTATELPLLPLSHRKYLQLYS